MLVNFLKFSFIKHWIFCAHWSFFLCDRIQNLWQIPKSIFIISIFQLTLFFIKKISFWGDCINLICQDLIISELISKILRAGRPLIRRLKIVHRAPKRRSLRRRFNINLFLPQTSECYSILLIILQNVFPLHLRKKIVVALFEFSEKWTDYEMLLCDFLIIR